ncbi:MAG: hypothetical protein MK554_11790, partial [Planctomycetes bacterium]|nr:hypothetical protein [Planctomycetota bacterium]
KGGTKPLAGGAPTIVIDYERVNPDGTRLTYKRYPDGTKLRGEGFFNIDFLFYGAVGIDLDGLSKEAVEALRVPLKVTIPFLVMIIASLLTKPNRREALDRFYVKMKTPTEIDPGKDREELELSYAEPDRYDYKKLFPGTALEFQRPGRADIAGFALSCLGVVGVILLALWVAGLGA